MMGKIKIFIDGACRGNPGDAAAGIIVCDAKGKVIHQVGYYLGRATNNVAEYMGLIKALEKARELMEGFSSFSLDYIPREENVLADRIANSTLDKASE